MSCSKDRPFFCLRSKKERPFDKLRANGNGIDAALGFKANASRGRAELRRFGEDQREGGVGVVPCRDRGPAAGAKQQVRVARAVFMAVLAVDRFALRPIIGPAVDREIHFARQDEHTSQLQSLMRISYAVFCLKKKKVSN